MVGPEEKPLGELELTRVRLLHKLEALDEAIEHLESARSPNRDGSLARLRQLRAEMLMALGLGDNSAADAD